MDAKARAEALMAELGPVLEPEAIIFEPATMQWSIALDGGRTVDVAYDAAAEALVFALRLGAPPAEAADRAYELLLRFSFLWRETGGLYTALDGDGAAVLMLRRSLEGLDATGLHILLQRLGANQTLWADLVARARSPEPEAAASPTPFPAIQV